MTYRAEKDNPDEHASIPNPSTVQKTTMLSQFKGSLTRLGLAEYTETLVSHGFETWDDLLDINEEDMEGLGFKRGHRRKLQRGIASYRGQPHSQPLSRSFPVDPLHESEQNGSAGADQDKGEAGELAPSKRKYRRRQPKDPLAPRLPSSDYVLFGNFLRQDPNVSKLSFVDISRLVGEKWQALSPEERAWWTSAAAVQKSIYNTVRAEYQKTEAFQKYQEVVHTKGLLKGILGDGTSRKGVQVKTEPILSRPRRRTLGSSRTESSIDRSKDSSITMAASEDGGHTASEDRGHTASFSKNFELPSFESSSPTMKVFEQTQILYRGQIYSDGSQNTSSLFNPPLQGSMMDSNQTAIPPQYHTKFAQHPSNLNRDGPDFLSRTDAEKSPSFHLQVLNPFRMIPGTTIWPMLESYLQRVNPSYYYVNAEHLVGQFNLAVNEAVVLPNSSMYTLCLCISIGCQAHSNGTDEMAIMWYENGRRYLDSDEWGWNLSVMRALALISMFHRRERPTTARHYLDIALRIGEANNLFANDNDASSMDNTPGNDWTFVWGTIQRIARVGLG